MAHGLYAHRGLKRFMTRSAGYKLIHDPVERVSEFFDLHADPGEQRSLVRDELSGEAARAYDRHLQELSGLAARFVDRTSPSVLSPEVRAELRALGYLDE
jgi:arylsulfatase A-like enzyme